MKTLIEQVKNAVDYWNDTELTKKFNKAVNMMAAGMLTPVDFAKKLTAIYDEAMTIPF